MDRGRDGCSRAPAAAFAQAAPGRRPPRACGCRRDAATIGLRAAPRLHHRAPASRFSHIAPADALSKAAWGRGLGRPRMRRHVFPSLSPNCQGELTSGATWCWSCHSLWSPCPAAPRPAGLGQKLLVCNLQVHVEALPASPFCHRRPTSAMLSLQDWHFACLPEGAYSTT